ncbi:MAG TPA: DUF3105 domain-containing protein [Solirubrobacteraceae bacterium]|nr:DUF3105 domain-containing protein [Solirubrobacteraceae bacterium]
MTPSVGGRRAGASQSGSRLLRVLEVLAIGVASLALSIGLIVLLSGFFVNRDQAGVSGSGAGPGQAFADLGHGVLRPGQARPAYNSDPPTSGSHVPAAVTRDDVSLSDDQLLQALQVGDVVIFYGTRQPPPGLTQFASSLAPPFTPSLAAVGSSVIIAPRPGTTGLLAAAWTHLLHVSGLGDSLRQFVAFWLGRGAGTGAAGSLPSGTIAFP